MQADQDLRLGIATPRQERASALQELLPTTPSPFWDAPIVEVRPLSAYDQVLWEVSR